MILSLFCGCGALDLGFESAGFEPALAYDIRPYSIESWNRNRSYVRSRGFVADVSQVSLMDMDGHYRGRFAPSGVIGGPPCQSFTRANRHQIDDDPRTRLVRQFFTLALRLHHYRNPLRFIVMENVRELATSRNGDLLRKEVTRLEKNGFDVKIVELNAATFSVPQHRHRLFIIAVHKDALVQPIWTTPKGTNGTIKVHEVLRGLPEPVHFSRSLDPEDIPLHPNHWCMKPKSKRFFDGSLKKGYSSGRSFKTLRWDEPSITVSYGHREVHIHPSGKRRLSVYEAMKLQGFPDDFVLYGPLSAQIDQVSEAVPPPLAEAVARSVAQAVGLSDKCYTAGARSSLSKSLSAESV